MTTSVIYQDDLSTGVRVSTIRAEDGGEVWYETLAYVREPFFSGQDPEYTYTKQDALDAHERRCKRVLGLV